MRKVAYGYVRVSTVGQAVEGVSLEAQQAKIAAWCEVNDYQLEGLYIDAGISGARADNRPELQNALDAVTRSQGCLIVYSLSRLARSTRDTIAISETLDKAGADLVSLSEKLDTTSAAGRMIFRMMAVLSEFEKDQISERTKAALSHKKSLGQRLGGTIPFGHDLADDGKTLIRNEKEQAAIELICLLRESAMSYPKIADLLTRKKVRTKDGSDAWTPTTVMRIYKRTAV